MDIFSINQIESDCSNDEIVRKFTTFKKTLGDASVLNDDFGIHLVRSLRKIQPIGSNNCVYAYSVQFPICNNDWTIPLFSFLTSISDDYWICNSYNNSQYITPNLFKYDVTNPQHRFPFVMWKRDY